MRYFLVIVLFFFLMGSNENLVAQCPTGYTPVRITMTINGCPYNVDLCVKCSVLGQLPNSVAVTGFMQIQTTPPCVQTLNVQQVLQYIETYVSTYDFYYSWLCQNNSSAPPCPQQSNEIEIYHWNCWKAELIEYAGQQSIYYSPCNYDTYCYEKISWCFDANQNKYVRTVVSGPTQIGGKPDCNLEAWEITLPTIVGQSSQCFILHSSCL
ncbi:hypothetical protein LBMAG35_14030 [Chlorobiota bacterium]|jgi:hypothetical protein|nr:hypothetical protein LBMAG35_14030 [Chlorobiota bacterium]